MKCECPHCNGSGEITTRCYDCGGTGEEQASFEECEVDKGSPHFDALMELKADIVRCRHDANRLIALKPEREDSYQRQLEVVMREIERQAVKLIEKP